MITALITVVWLACAAFNVYGVSRMFEYLPVTLQDVLICTILAPIMLFIVLGGLAGKVEVIKSRK